MKANNDNFLFLDGYKPFPLYTLFTNKIKIETTNCGYQKVISILAPNDMIEFTTCTTKRKMTYIWDGKKLNVVK